MGKKILYLEDLNRKLPQYLTEMTKHHPERIWEQVAKYLNTQKDFLKTLAFEQWLREADLSEVEKDKGTISLIPQRSNLAMDR